MSVPDRRAKLDRADRTLSIRRQCALVGVARSIVYRPRRPANDNDVVPMRLIDELFTGPFYCDMRSELHRVSALPGATPRSL
jgi:hypothetical protein